MSHIYLSGIPTVIHNRNGEVIPVIPLSLAPHRKEPHDSLAIDQLTRVVMVTCDPRPLQMNKNSQ